jgi:hypothetical protein
MKTLGIRELPLTLDLARQHLRLGDTTHDDALVVSNLEMAVAAAEDMTGRYIRGRTVEFHVLCPADDTLLMPLPAHTASVTELSVSGVKIPKDKYTLLLSDYEPVLYIDREFEGRQVHLKIVVGYTKTNIPPAIKAAILLILGTLYDNESDNVVGRVVSELSLTAEKLLAPWRVTPYGK